MTNCPGKSNNQGKKMNPASPREHYTDWLSSQPIFYNTRTLAVSSNINDVIDINCLEFHAEGFNNYLDCGFSVFGQTPIRDVKFLAACERIVVEHGKLTIEKTADPLERFDSFKVSEHDLPSLTESFLSRWEKSSNELIILPLSGGYDSRFLASLVSRPQLVRAFSYGLSRRQSKSFEVTKARRVAERCRIHWTQIELGEFHQYFEEWEKQFGASVHAHGMYHIEFYRKILESEDFTGCRLLSGIVGDAWAGGVPSVKIERPEDLINTVLSHGIRADSRYSKLKSDPELCNEHWAQNKHSIGDPRIQIVQRVRQKMILLSYLYRVPACLGLKPWSPFLEPEIALGMLNLPQDRRHERRWQRDYFVGRRLLLEEEEVRGSRLNQLNLVALKKIPLPPLDVEILEPFLSPDYVKWVNRVLPRFHLIHDMASLLRRTRFVGRIARRVMPSDPRLVAYFAYLTLLPIERLLKQREKSSSGL